MSRLSRLVPAALLVSCQLVSVQHVTAFRCDAQGGCDDGLSCCGDSAVDVLDASHRHDGPREAGRRVEALDQFNVDLLEPIAINEEVLVAAQFTRARRQTMFHRHVDSPGKKGRPKSAL